MSGSRRRTLLVAMTGALFTWCSAAEAAEAYPTRPDDQDKLCERLGDPRSPPSPKDRPWFEENCKCRPGAGCGAPRSRRFAGRIAFAERRAAEGERAQQQRRDRAKTRRQRDASRLTPAAEKAQKKAVAREETAALRAAYWQCAGGPAKADCRRQAAELEAACAQHGLLARRPGKAGDECYARADRARRSGAPRMSP